MDFFNNIYFDNPVKNYCIVGGSILLVLILKKYLSRYIASLLFRLTHQVWRNIEKKNFVDLVVEPLEWFLLILITVFSIDKLNFPEAWQYKIYGHSTEQILNKTGIGIIIVSFTWLLLRIIDFIALVLEKRASHTDEKRNDQLIVFFRDFLKVILAIAGLLLLVKACFNQPVGNLLTSLSIVGAVLALAAKESLENLIASFIIFFDKPFATGDVLKVNAVAGTVEKIGLRSTRIRTADKTLVSVPNKQMVDSVVDNWSMRTHRRAEIKLELSPNTTAEASTHFIAEIKKILLAKIAVIASSSVYLAEINKSGVLVTIEYFTLFLSLDQFNGLKEEMNISLKKLLEENDLTMAAATNTVNIINESKEE
jgi:MscS family membrane protein